MNTEVDCSTRLLCIWGMLGSMFCPHASYYVFHSIPQSFLTV